VTPDSALVATPAAAALLPSEVAPLKNSTEPAALGLTVAVRVKLAGAEAGDGGFAVSAVVVGVATAGGTGNTWVHAWVAGSMVIEADAYSASPTFCSRIWNTFCRPLAAVLAAKSVLADQKDLLVESSAVAGWVEVPTGAGAPTSG